MTLLPSSENSISSRSTASPASRARTRRAVEGQIGWFRRNHLVPVPELDSLAELNATIDKWDADDESRRIGARPHTIGEHFAIDRPLLKPLPDEPFETGRWFTPRVDRYSQVSVRTTATRCR